MITIRLLYPYQQDLCSYGVPLPELIGTKDVCILLFEDASEHDTYLNLVCDIVDKIEYSRRSRYNKLEAEKLGFCRRYLELLAGARTFPS
ncbi:MAG TPA: hypothetical protein VHW43_07990 [Puia sp.]|nr:hypothetical protein [Puia sp.]